MVNGCFDALIRAAGHEGGDVLKFGGDALLVWFEGEGHEVRAARARRRMQRAIGAARFTRAGLGMSVGAHTGDFDLFLVGPTRLARAGARRGVRSRPPSTWRPRPVAARSWSAPSSRPGCQGGCS